MATMDHGPSCRCTDCRARRAVAPAPQPGRSDDMSLPLDEVKEIAENEKEAIKADPIKASLVLMEDDNDAQEVARILSLAGIDKDAIPAIVQQAGKLYEAGRRKRGIRRILTGIAIALFAIFAVETVMWLITGNFGSFGVIDAIFVLVGLYYVVRGVYEVVTANRSVEKAG